jgi:hypothetical protein
MVRTEWPHGEVEFCAGKQVPEEGKDCCLYTSSKCRLDFISPRTRIKKAQNPYDHDNFVEKATDFGVELARV